ncbi:DUF2846 domain-containing protein [Sphingobium sp. AN558]|uniref:DUF2846 domain-containing protein n=1 Tax=Sphingobium sp. AN558 TaxID=3133442 RepID=UPI0040407243
MLGLLTLLIAGAAAPPTLASEKGKIILYRGSSLGGAAIACPIRYKGEQIIELGRGKYAEWHVPAGSYILTNKTASIEVNVAAGQTKYVRCQIKAGIMSGRADLQIVDQESFAAHSVDYERKDVSAQVLSGPHPE